MRYVARTYGYRGEVNAEWVHPVVAGQNGVLDGNMTRDTLTVAGLAPVAESCSHMSLKTRESSSEEQKGRVIETNVNLDPFALIIGVLELGDSAEVDGSLCVTPPRPAKRVLLQLVDRLMEAVGVSRLRDWVSGGGLRSEGGSGGHG